MDKSEAKDLIIIAGDTLPPQTQAFREGRSHFQIGQRPYQMGNEAPDILISSSTARPSKTRSSPASTSAPSKTQASAPSKPDRKVGGPIGARFGVPLFDLEPQGRQQLVRRG